MLLGRRIRRCLLGLLLSWRVMVRWMPRRVLRGRRLVWLRMRWRLVMLLGVRRSRRTLLTLVRLPLGCLLVMRRRAPRLRRATRRMRLVTRLRRLVLVMLRCRRRILPRVVPRLLLRMLVARSRRRMVWIRWFPTLPVFSRGRLRTT